MSREARYDNLVDVIDGLPRWVWEVVWAIEEYEDQHPRVAGAGGWGCISDVLDLIPDELRRIARVLRDVGVLGSQTPTGSCPAPSDADGSATPTRAPVGTTPTHEGYPQ